MSQLAQDMKQLPTLPNKLQVDQLPMLTLRPAMEELPHTLTQPNTQEPKMEEQSHMFQRPHQTVEQSPLPNKPEPHQEVALSLMLMRQLQMEELLNSLNKLQQPQTVVPSHLLLEQHPMEEQPHTLFHLHLAHTPPQKEEELHTLMSQQAQVLKPLPMFLNQLPTEQLPMLIPSPAMEDHHHTLNQLKLKLPEMEALFL